ncbi:MAG: hypothetical protein AAF581_20680 [Planctomycetota bacterium]
MTQLRACIAVALCAFAGPAFAGTHTTTTSPQKVPADTLLYWGWDGTAALDAPFKATGMGKLCAEPAIAQLLETAWGRVRAELPPPVVAGLTQLRLICRYPGSFSFLGVSGADAQPLLAMQIECGDKAAGQLHEMIEDLRTAFGLEALTPLEMPGAKLTRVAVADLPFALVYGQAHGGYIICIGDAAAREVVGRRAPSGDEPLPTLRENPRFVAALPHVGDHPALGHLFVDIAGAIEALKRFFTDQGQSLPPIVSSIVDSDEVKKLQALTWALSLDGAGFRRVLHLGIDGAQPEPAVTDQDLLAVPRDCEFFTLTHSDLRVWYGLLRSFLGTVLPDVEQFVFGAIEDFETEAKLRIDEDLLASLGTQFLMYTEPGHGGLMSMSFTLVLKPTDAAKLDSCLRKLTDFIGTMVSGMLPDVRVAIHAIETSGSNVTQVTLQGAPIGLAPAWAIHKDRMVFGLTAIDVLETLRRLQANDPQTSILANADFQARRQTLPSGAHGLTYVDMKQTARTVYPWFVYGMQAGMSYFGQDEPTLGAALMPPPYRVQRAFFGDITAEYTDSHGYTAIGHGPLPLALPASTAMYIPVVAGIAGMAAARVADISADTAQARETFVEQSMRSVAMATEMYRIDHDRYPDSLSQLHPDYVRTTDSISDFAAVRRIDPESGLEELLLYQRQPASDGLAYMHVRGAAERGPERVPFAEVQQMITEWQKQKGGE